MCAGHYPPYKVDVPFGSYNGLKWFYYLADGIYPDWKIFAKTITLSRIANQRAYCQLQDGVRKDVERTCRNPLKRFHILAIGASSSSYDDLMTIITCCTVFHNMLVDVVQPWGRLHPERKRNDRLYLNEGS